MSSTKPTYDEIGRTYTSTRRPDPRIAAKITAALGDATTVVNVGAGAGSYEPDDRNVVAVEPSTQMIGQRSIHAAPVIRGVAEALPFAEDAFDAALANLTLHHWTDWRQGLDEMRRVARRIVLFTFEPQEVGRFWLTDEYFPEIVDLDLGRCPSVAEVKEHLDGCEDMRIGVPHDCTDGFLAAFWRRPEAYLDPQTRASMSAFALLDDDVVDRGVARLADDLRSGAWERKFGDLLALDELDVCYRLLAS